MRVGFTGSRKVQDLSLIRPYLDEISDRELWITGGAIGTDILVAEYCIEHNIPYIVILPFPFEIHTRGWSEEWKQRLRRVIENAVDVATLCVRFKKTCYYLRNLAIVQMSDILYAFLLGESRGTMMTIEIAKKLGKTVKVFKLG